MAMGAFPSRNALTAKTTSRYGGAGTTDPGPTLCQARVYNSQMSSAPDGAGSSAPPCKTPGPHHSPRVATTAKTVSPNTSNTLGRQNTRRTQLPDSSKNIASSSTGPLSNALTADGGAPLVVRTPVTASSVCRT